MWGEISLSADDGISVISHRNLNSEEESAGRDSTIKRETIWLGLFILKILGNSTMGRKLIQKTKNLHENIVTSKHEILNYIKLF